MLFDADTLRRLTTVNPYTERDNEIRARWKNTNRQKRGPRPRAESKIKPRPNPFRQPIASTEETEFRHERWAAERARVRAAMLAAGTGIKPLERFDQCGAECMVEWSDEAQRYRLKASYCHCRHCQPCGKSRAVLISKNLINKLNLEAEKGTKHFKFYTATLKHSPAPLKTQIKRLYACFKKLRNTKIWKLTQRGGAVMFEVKLNEQNEWHPHLHIVGEGGFLSHKRLVKEWHEITGDSYIFDVKEIDSAKSASHYICKYASKGTTSNVWANPRKAAEYVEAMRGVRVCMTYGTWRGYGLMKIDPANIAKDWKPVKLLSQMVRDAWAGSTADCDMLVILWDSLQYDPHKKRKHKEAG